MFLHRIEYRTVEGAVISRVVNTEYGITVEDINDLACQYLEKTYREPQAVFMRTDMYAKLLHDAAQQMRSHSMGTNSGATALLSLWLSTGNVIVKSVPHLYTPVFVGTWEECLDNDINTIFEETVLKDCDRA